MSKAEESYQDIFEQIKQFKLEQNKQKQRGLNNYNILTSVLKKSDEVRLHSRMIFSFLNPNGTHYQENLFLDKFLEVLNVNSFNINSKNCSVYREYENIDLYITDGAKHIIIENKVGAPDQENQIKRYIEIIENENTNLKLNDILVIYLSLDRDKPSEYSLENLKVNGNFIERDNKNITLFQSIHYKSHILEWLEKCQYEVQNITNLNEAFKQYIDVVKMINNQYKDKIMSLEDCIKDNKDIYNIAIELKEVLPKVRKKIIDDFFEQIISVLQKSLGDEWTVELKENSNLSKRYGFPFKIYKKSWINDKKNNLIFGFEFYKNDYYGGYFGIVRESNSVDIENDVSPKFSQRLNSLNVELDTDDECLHWDWLAKLGASSDFVEYVLFDEDAEESFLAGILKLIKNFEDESNLMSDINDYLSQKSH